MTLRAEGRKTTNSTDNVKLQDPKMAEQQELNPNAYPLADPELTEEILDMVQLTNENRQLKKGINETTKTVHRGMSEFVVMAADASTFEIILHIPLLCEDRCVPYVFVRSMRALGQACGMSSRRHVVACTVIVNAGSHLKPSIRALKKKLQKLFI
ncbi:NHP2-like protein 1 [Glandiceps talaboti]